MWVSTGIGLLVIPLRSESKRNKTYLNFLEKFQVSSDTMSDNIILKFENNAPGIHPPEIKEKCQYYV